MGESVVKSIEFTVWGPPQGKLRARTGNGRWYTPKKTQEYQALVRDVYALAARHRARVPHPHAVKLSAVPYYPIPKNKEKWWREQAEQGRIPAMTVPDGDNVLKVIADALKGIAWKDDRQITTWRAEKLYSKEPRVETRIEFLPASKRE